jgi:hypothetical protein
MGIDAIAWWAKAHWYVVGYPALKGRVNNYPRMLIEPNVIGRKHVNHGLQSVVIRKKKARADCEWYKKCHT